MTRPRQRRSDRSGRRQLRSPGRPLVGRREGRQRFRAAIARGLFPECVFHSMSDTLSLECRTGISLDMSALRSIW